MTGLATIILYKCLLIASWCGFAFDQLLFIFTHNKCYFNVEHDTEEMSLVSLPPILFSTRASDS